MTYTIGMEKSCPFCDNDERILKSNEHAVLILSNPRKVPGHALVIPKRHVEKPWEITAEERLAIFALIDEAEQKLITAGLGDGCDVRQNYRPFQPQGRVKVNHVHYHIIPRALDDYIYQISEKYDTELFADLDPKEASEVDKLLK